jgi:uncharacterized protein (DUF2252 family)
MNVPKHRSHTDRPARADAPLADRATRHAAGKALRDKVAREQHGRWAPASKRRDVVDQVIESNEGRIPDLVPIRHGRMMVSPFTFFRGTADVMAADLAPTPVSGVSAQICGDCHLLNLGAFATPERRMIVDINDFDETLPGPWEWDLKRLAASFVLAARSNGLAPADQRDAALACARAYRERMAEYSRMHALDVWYARVDLGATLALAHDKASAARLRKRVQKAAQRTVAEYDFPKLVQQAGRPSIKDAPPLIYHHAQLTLERSRDAIARSFADYRATLADDRRVLLDRYRIEDFALKVVGVGSVGTFCAVLLLLAEGDDPLFLQVKEARRSVLEHHLPRSRYANHGERVVVGQRLMQSASDIFLGWTQGHAKDKRHFYLRQLRDMKVKPLVEIYTPSDMADYGSVCGWALAHAHARSGDAAAISGYLGKSDVFDQALARFGASYADQAERDHAAFLDAIRSSRIEAMPEH